MNHAREQPLWSFKVLLLMFLLKCSAKWIFLSYSIGSNLSLSWSIWKPNGVRYSLLLVTPTSLSPCRYCWEMSLKQKWLMYPSGPVSSVGGVWGGWRLQAQVLEPPMNLLYAFLSSVVALRVRAEDGDSLTMEGSESPLGGQVGCPSRNSHIELSMHQE